MALSHAIPPRLLRAGLVGTALLALAGCGTFGSSSKESACPVTGVLDKAGTLVRFADTGGRDPQDVSLQVAVADIGTKCSIESKTGTARVEMRIDFRAERGPANQSPTDRFAYFIAVADPGGNVTARQSFDKAVSFPAAGGTVATTDEIATSIPLDRGQRIQDFRLYVAIQLTTEELEYNRAYRGR